MPRKLFNPRPGGNKASAALKGDRRRGKAHRNDAGKPNEQVSSNYFDRGALESAWCDRGEIERRGATSTGWPIPFVVGLGARIIR
jgi:hypothetical protein